MTRLTLGNGTWIDVKDSQKVRDRKEIHSYSVDGVATDQQTYRFNIVKHQIATAASRILNWNVPDEDGKPVPWPAGRPFKDRIAVIEGLDEKVFEDITEAINKHIELLDAAAVAEKNAMADGVTDSVTSSPSAS